MTNETLFYVHHQILDKAAWAERYETIIEESQGSYQDVAAKPMWKGNAAIWGISSLDGNHAFCIWQCETGTTLSDFQAFIDEFSEGTSKDTPAKIENICGGDNLDFETLIQDLQKLGKDGHVHPYAGEGELWFARDVIPEQAKWDEFAAEKFAAAKGKGSATELSQAWGLPVGVNGVFTIFLSDGEGTLCLSEVPKDYTEEDYKMLIDNFNGESAKNQLFGKVNPVNSLNSRVLHPDFYAQEMAAYAETK